MPELDETTTADEVTEETTADVDAAAGSDTIDTDDANPEGADQLGDAGKKALDSMKAKWRAERDKRRELETKLSERDTAPKGDDKDQPNADEIRREALRAANARIVRSELKAAATGKLADPTDAIEFLRDKLNTFEVDDDGNVDVDELNDAIEELLTRKPHLAAATAKRFQGTGDGGAATRKASGPSQLTRADLERMSPEQIVKAKKDGRLKNLLGGKD